MALPLGACAPKRRRRIDAAQGYSLLELLIALSVSIILLTIGFSGFSALATNTYRRNAVQALLSTVERARHLALTINQRTLVCSIDIEGRCTEDWRGVELAIIPDRNNNRRQDIDEVPVYRQPWWPDRIQVAWTNWLGDSTITYQMDGSVASNGTLYLSDSLSKSSSPDESVSEIKASAFVALVISKGGRTRVEPGT
jgi:Tfp pilus assembly protein FimT